MKAGVEQKQQQKPGIEWAYNGDVINYGGVLFYLPLVETIDIQCVYIIIYIRYILMQQLLKIMSRISMGMFDQDSIGTISPVYHVNNPGGIPIRSDLNEVVTNLNINVLFSHNRNVDNNSDKMNIWMWVQLH